MTAREWGEMHAKMYINKKTDPVNAFVDGYVAGHKQNEDKLFIATAALKKIMEESNLYFSLYNFAKDTLTSIKGFDSEKI